MMNEEKWLVGVDIGGTTVKLGFVSQEGELIHRWSLPTNLNRKGRFIPLEIADSILQKLQEIGQPKEKLLGVGIGAPGPINVNKGSIDIAINLGWVDFPLKQLLEDALSLPVIVENDANVAALGEMWKGAGFGAKDIICVTLGTGVGGAVIVDGEVVHGVNGAAGEIGHTVSLAEGGVLCACGKTGCLETIASAPGIVRLAMEELSNTAEPSELRAYYDEHQAMSSKLVFEVAKKGDVIGKKVMDQVTFYLGLALANLANALNPEKIVIGGGVSKVGEPLLTPLKEQFNRFTFPSVKEGAELVIASLGDNAGIIGGAWLVKRSFR